MTKRDIMGEFRIENLEETIATSKDIKSNYIHVKRETDFTDILEILKGNVYLGIVAGPKSGMGTRFVIAHIHGKKIIYNDKQETPLLLPQNFLNTERKLRNNNSSHNYSLVITNSPTIEDFQRITRAQIYPIENFS